MNRKVHIWKVRTPTDIITVTWSQWRSRVGIDPCTSRMLREHSTIWVTSLRHQSPWLKGPQTLLLSSKQRPALSYIHTYTRTHMNKRTNERTKVRTNKTPTNTLATFVHTHTMPHYPKSNGSAHITALTWKQPQTKTSESSSHKSPSCSLVSWICHHEAWIVSLTRHTRVIETKLTNTPIHYLIDTIHTRTSATEQLQNKKKENAVSSVTVAPVRLAPQAVVLFSPS